jgi:2-amino-4-hydroxy-6-hydroxymethyldihydropteridine diphosphokinase
VTPPVAFVALGSNLGESAGVLREVFARLGILAAGAVARSSLWRSAPVDCPPGSPDFLNAVAAFTPRPGETPESLLAELQRLERDFGRQPKKLLNEARALDLDLLAFGYEVRQTSTLTLPHPRAHLRRFVLAPLCELAPDLILPGQTRPVRELLAALPPADCRRVE